MKVGKIVQLNNDESSAMVAYKDLPGHVGITIPKSRLEELERDAEALKRVVADIQEGIKTLKEGLDGYTVLQPQYQIIKAMIKSLEGVLALASKVQV